MEKIDLIVKLVERFYGEIQKGKDTNVRRRGRPRKYPDLLILTLGVIKEIYGLSFRKTLSLAKKHFENVPALRAFHYRLSKLDDVLKELVEKVQNELRKQSAE